MDAYVGESVAMKSAIASKSSIARRDQTTRRAIGQARFDFILRERTVQAGVLQSPPHFVENVKVVLNILDRAVIGELLEKLFDVLFCRTHLF